MSRCVWRSTALMLFCALIVLAEWPARAAEPQAWISSNDPTHGGAADFWEMFAPNAPWQSAKQHVAVFSIDQNLVTNGPPDKLRQFYAFLKENQIALAIGIGMLTWNEPCGKHVEGYVPPGGSDYVAKRIKSLGGELAYIGIDEAFWFGRYYSGANACHASVDTLAADVAANFRAYQAVFPNVRLGDVEPLGPPPGGDRPGSSWAKTTQAWIDALQAKSGARLAFIHEDITDWRRPLPEYLPAVADLAKANHIPFAPIFIAARGDVADGAWMASAEQNIDAVRGLHIGSSDHLVFATWHVHPTKNLPETSPEAFTHLIVYYYVGR
ncbi:hypothetical protein FXB40_05925 [Bradyrhizobium rifense]|uniref:Uncharacterized protein n=1 Tax=Bradyrhizobium rifense TaxID=515499 RepID=A0A5D3KXT7_9BRAD|nr:hypothetical protein [Bradyrhizobium rifense]TYL98020.1 hypothetical protein FXB40_05925 [Bradyrhizobium rifense]